MGYTLLSRKKLGSSIDIGAFSWPMFLQETGAGFVLGYCAGKGPGSYVYQSNNVGSPVSNDGYKVTSFQAKAMAACMRGYITVSAFVNKEWETEYPDEDKRKEAQSVVSPFTNKLLCNVPMGKTRLEELVKIADFMEASGGFTIE